MKILLHGSSQLAGRITISGAKNAALPLLATSLLTDESFILNNLPMLRDVENFLGILRELGCELIFRSKGQVQINAAGLNNLTVPYERVKQMRASIMLLGPLLAKHGHAEIALPGGCAIGLRPVDIHLDCLKAMGAEIKLENGVIIANCPNGLRGARVKMRTVSVTATENIMLAASLARGETIIEAAAREPEIMNVAECLTAMGAKVSGAGTSTVKVVGVSKLNGAEQTVYADRIEAGTYLVAAAMTQGSITLNNVNHKHLQIVLQKLEEAGAKLDVTENSISLKMAKRPKAVDVVTEIYPGFPTDMQAQFMALNSIAKGQAKVTEHIFENRFMHVPELRRLGVDIRVEGNTAVINGKSELFAAPVNATDLRASACLVLAGLVAKGQTEISKVYHLDRGYAFLEEKLALLNARIKRICVENPG